MQGDRADGDTGGDRAEAVTVMSEDALPASAELYHAVLETALDAIVTMDAAGCIVEFNPAAEAMFGYSRAAALGQELAALIIPPDLQTRHRAGLSRYLVTGQGPLIGRRTEVQGMRADGSLFPVELAITRVSLNGPPLFTGYIRDITDRKRAEEERTHLLLAEQEARREAVARANERDAAFEAMVDGVIVFGADGKIMRMNAAFRALLALPPEAEALYRSYTVGERIDQTAMRDGQGRPLPHEQQPVARILRGEVLTGADAVDIIVRAFDGHDVQIAVTGAPVYDGADHISGGVCICRDVTERRRWERRTHAALDALLAMAGVLVGGGRGEEAATAPHSHAVGQRLAELTRHVLACQHVAILSIEPRTEHLQPVAAAGFSPDDEQRWWRQWEQHPRLRDRLHADHIATLRADNVLLLDRTQPPFNRETALGRRLVLMVPLRVGDELTGILSVDHGRAAHDYTPDEVALARAAGRLAALVIERERLLQEHAEARANELALREANRRMDEFLGIAGHEMRTPLTTIWGNIQVAQRRLTRLAGHEGTRANTNAVAAFLDDIRRVLGRTDLQVRRLDRLIDDLLDVSRIHAGRLALRPAPCDLAAVVCETVEEQRHVAPTRAIHLQIGAEQPVPVIADAERIAQVVTNYVSNALRYSSPEQPVAVGLDVVGEVARVWVRDAGPGLAAAEQERVWERFYRVEGIAPQYGSSVGLGLGLHISRTIVEGHGGQVGVESTPGAGATFWFTLPLLAPQG